MSQQLLPLMSNGRFDYSMRVLTRICSWKLLPNRVSVAKLFDWPQEASWLGRRSLERVVCSVHCCCCCCLSHWDLETQGIIAQNSNFDKILCEIIIYFSEWLNRLIENDGLRYNWKTALRFFSTQTKSTVSACSCIQCGI